MIVAPARLGALVAVLLLAGCACVEAVPLDSNCDEPGQCGGAPRVPPPANETQRS